MNRTACKTIAVETKSLTKKFGDFTAVDHLSIRVEEGSVYGFLGPNGSGKSTTIRMLCGLLGPTEGAGLVLGMDLARDGQRLKRQVGYMSQKFSIYPELTVIENLNFYAGLYGLSRGEKGERIKNMLRLAGLTGRENEIVRGLAGGWRQRLALGCAILHRPRILFLDEPTSGVDPASRRLFWDIIYDLADDGTTVMVTTHFMDEAEHCDKVAFIYCGRLIADDTPEKLKKLIPGTLYEIESERGMELLAEIEAGALGGLIDSYFFGERLRVIVPGERSLGGEALLKETKIKRVKPSMEDVFSYLVLRESEKQS